MEFSWLDFAINFLADIAGTFVVFGFTLGALLNVRYSGRGRFIRFLNLDSDKTDIQFFLSRIDIRDKPGGVRATDPVEGEILTTGFTGPALSGDEVEAVETFREYLGNAPLATVSTSLRRALSQILGSKSLLPVKVRSTFAPKADQLDLSSYKNKLVIILGNATYNSVASYYFKNATNHLFEFARVPIDSQNYYRALFAHDKNRGKIELQGSGNRNSEVGVIHRGYDETNELSFIICAGLGATATKGSLLFLIANWKEIAEGFPKNQHASPFTTFIEFPDAQTDNNTMWIENTEVIYQKKNNKGLGRVIVRSDIRLASN